MTAKTPYKLTAILIRKLSSLKTGLMADLLCGGVPVTDSIGVNAT